MRRGPRFRHLMKSMDPEDRELRWALLCYAELALIASITFLVPSSWLEGYVDIPAEVILLPSFLALFLVPVLLLSILSVRYLVLVRGWSVSSRLPLVVSHLAGALIGAVTAVVLTTPDAAVLGVLLFLILVIPRVALSSLRT